VYPECFTGSLVDVLGRKYRVVDRAGEEKERSNESGENSLEELAMSLAGHLASSRSRRHRKKGGVSTNSPIPGRISDSSAKRILAKVRENEEGKKCSDTACNAICETTDERPCKFQPAFSNTLHERNLPERTDFWISKKKKLGVEGLNIRKTKGALSPLSNIYHKECFYTGFSNSVGGKSRRIRGN